MFQINEPKLTEAAKEGEQKYQAMNIKRSTALNLFDNLNRELIPIFDFDNSPQKKCSCWLKSG
jgi:hypothetical protein